MIGLLRQFQHLHNSSIHNRSSKNRSNVVNIISLLLLLLSYSYLISSIDASSSSLSSSTTTRRLSLSPTLSSLQTVIPVSSRERNRLSSSLYNYNQEEEEEEEEDDDNDYENDDLLDVETLTSLGMSDNDIDAFLGRQSSTSASGTDSGIDDNDTTTTTSIMDEDEDLFLINDDEYMNDEYDIYDDDEEEEEEIMSMDTNNIENTSSSNKIEKNENQNDWWKDPFVDFNNDSIENVNEEREEESLRDVEEQDDTEVNQDDIEMDQEGDDDDKEELILFDGDLDEEVEGEEIETGLEDDDDLIMQDEMNHLFSIDENDNLVKNDEDNSNMEIEEDTEALYPELEYDYEEVSENDEEDMDDIKPMTTSQKSTIDSIIKSSSRQTKEIQSRENGNTSTSSTTTALPALLIPKIGNALIHSPFAIQLFAGFTIVNIAYQRFLVSKKKGKGENKFNQILSGQSHLYDSDDSDDETDMVEDIGFGRPRPIQKRSGRIKQKKKEIREEIGEEEGSVGNFMEEDQPNNVDIVSSKRTQKPKKGLRLWGRKREHKVERQGDDNEDTLISSTAGGQKSSKAKKEIKSQLDEIDRLKERSEIAEVACRRVESEYDEVVERLRETQKQLLEIGRTNNFLKNQVRDNKNALERAVSAERQRTNAELSRVRDQMIAVLERERRIMRAQLMKSSAQVRSLIAKQVEYDDDYEGDEQY